MVSIVTEKAGVKQAVPVGDDWLSTAAEAFDVLAEVGGSSVRQRPTSPNETVEKTTGENRDRYEIVFPNGEVGNVGQLLKGKVASGPDGHWEGTGAATRWEANNPTAPVVDGLPQADLYAAFAALRASDPNAPYGANDRALLLKIATKLGV
tara:strand:+ start:590 stop:1042 length:453 start_codon:yes stop_codon:yes gene_type:complete